jgi:hypothetical protein
MTPEEWLEKVPEPYRKFAREAMAQKVEDIAEEIEKQGIKEVIDVLRQEYIEYHKVKTVLEKHGAKYMPKF